VNARSARVGFVGLGAMGSRMARRLLDSGHSLVVYNRTAQRARDLELLGADCVSTPRDVAEQADIVCGCLLNSVAVEDVYISNAGLIASSRPGQVFVEHGTFAPELAKRIALELEQRGAAFLDAPVTGGPDAASSGELTMMMGGSDSAVAQVADIVRIYASRVAHVGPAGAGLQLKLINQLLVSCHVAAAAEAAALVQRLNLPLQSASDALNAGWAASAMLERGLSRLRDQELGISDVSIGGLVEPQRLVEQLADEAGLSLTLMPVVSQMFQDACADGMGGLDLAAMVRFVDERPHETGAATQPQVAG
jgi:3-hydroxyisobutyrate dehydrogenase-like beta-hydroxyacid dehydrogenase